MNNEMKKKLDERLVNGEITTEEYEKILNTIELTKSTESISSENNMNSKINVSVDKDSIDSASSNSTRKTINETAVEKGFFKKLRDGDYGLAKTYWLYGIVVGIVFAFIERLILMAMGKEGVLLALVIVLVSFVYAVFFQIQGLWRAAKKYQGSRIWAILAQIVVVVTIISIPFALIQWLRLLKMAGIF